MPHGDANGPFTNAADDASDSRALVVVQPATSAAPHRPMLPRSSAFLAQLIATKLDLAATRARRRASAAVAISAYRAPVANRPPRMRGSA